MFELDRAVYLVTSHRNTARVLQAGKVLLTGPEEFSAAFDETFPLEPGADLIAMGETDGRFFQQGVRVLELDPAWPTLSASFKRIGDITSAEQRQMFRVSVATAGLAARIGDEKHCPVVDLSPEGFAAIVHTKLTPGSLIPVCVNYDHMTVFATTARVQTIKPRRDGMCRYGFLAPDAKSTARKAMQQMTSFFQRQQLRRFSGAA